jgi:purine/pyrimidine-nucleoside phosphorylase
MLKHNSYFEGKVQSVGFERNGRRATVGVIDVGEFHFGTDAPERMTVTSGELWARLPGEAAFRAFPAGTAFEVPATSGFDVKATAPAAHLCEFLWAATACSLCVARRARYGRGMISHRPWPLRTPVALAAMLAAAGCVSMLPSVTVRDETFQAMSAGGIGCPAEEIVISRQRNEFHAGDAPPTWVATCRGRRFVCSGAGSVVNCAEELKPAPAAQ